jgi:hypothetical protein
MRSDDERKHHTAYRSHGQVEEEDAPLGGTTVDGRGALIRRVLQGRWLLEARAVGYSRDSLHCSRGAVHREGIGSRCLTISSQRWSHRQRASMPSSHGAHKSTQMLGMAAGAWRAIETLSAAAKGR